MARTAIAAVKAHCVADLKMAHEFAQIDPRGVNQQVKVVVHQNIGHQLDLIDFAAVGQLDS